MGRKEKGKTRIAEIVWFPEKSEVEEPKFQKTFADEIFRLEYEKRLKQCEAILSFLDGMKGKDLEPYLSKFNLCIGTEHEIAVTIKIPLRIRLHQSEIESKQ